MHDRALAPTPPSMLSSCSFLLASRRIPNPERRVRVSRHGVEFTITHGDGQVLLFCGSHSFASPLFQCFPARKFINCCGHSSSAYLRLHTISRIRCFIVNDASHSSIFTATLTAPACNCIFRRNFTFVEAIFIHVFGDADRGGQMATLL